MYINYPAQHHICYTHTLWCLLDTLSGQRRTRQRTRPPTNMVRGSWGIFRQIDSKGGINEKKCSQMLFESLPPKDVTLNDKELMTLKPQLISSRSGGPLIDVICHSFGCHF